MVYETQVPIGSAKLSLADALALYRERREALNPQTSAEAVALWNAIQRADKIAKGISVGPPISTPGLVAAIARLEAELLGSLIREAA